MSERYIKVFSGNENLYLEGAPIIIRASALLKDTDTGKMIAQLKLQNISGKSISYVKVALTQLDSVRNPLDKTIDFEYLDLAIADKEEFGSKKPIFLPNSSSRSFNVGVSHIGFVDGTVWTSENTNWQSAEKDSETTQIVATEDVYKKAIELSRSKHIEQLRKAIVLFEGIQDKKDVFCEIEACAKKIQEIDEAKSKSKSIISKVFNKKVARLAGISLIFILLSWIIFSISAATKTQELAIEVLSNHPNNNASEVINDFKHYNHYTMSNGYYALAQLTMVGFAVALLFIKKIPNSFGSIARIILSSLNLATAVLTFVVCQPPNPYWAIYSFYFDWVQIFLVINCAVSMLFLCIILFMSQKKGLFGKC